MTWIKKTIKKIIDNIKAVNGGYFFLFSLFIMLLYTSSSPLYVTNPWVDSNSFMTMGRGIWHGLVPYRDLFEQKGPILYFMHTLGYLISPGQFWGVYILQSLAMTINIVYFYKTAKLFLSEHVATIIALFIPATILNSFFHYGNSAEEFVLPAIFILIYTIFNASQKEEFSFTNKELCVQGMLLAYVFWIKYSLIGAWITFVIIYAAYLIVKKDFTKLRQGLLFGLNGFLLVSSVVMVYFAINNATYYLLDVYFITNITAYAQGNVSVIARLFNAFAILISRYRYHPIVSLIVIIGLVAVGYTTLLTKRNVARLMIVSSFLATGILQYYGGIIIGYYFLIMSPFISIGLMAIMKVLVDKKISIFEQKSTATILFIVTSAIFLPLVGNANINHSRLFPNNDYIQIPHWANTTPNSGLTAQQYFAQIINEVPDATLLNYGFLDGGFYLAANILPVNRFMMINNISHWNFPEMWNEQTMIVEQGLVDFVVVRTTADMDISGYGFFHADQVNFNLLNQNYQLVAVHVQRFEGWEFRYLLYQLNPN